MKQVRLDKRLSRFQAVVDYLSREDYYGPVLVILDCLESFWLPKSFPEVDDPAFVHVLGARKALLHSSGLFRILFHWPKSSKRVQDYVRRCIEEILERWEGVCKWMMLLIENDTIDVVPPSTDANECYPKMTALQNCVDTLIAIFKSGAGNPLVELVSLPCTLNLFFSVLSQVDHSSGKYEMWDAYSDPGAKCAVTELVHACWETCKAGRDAAVLRLEAQKRSARQKVFSSLTRRAQQMAEDADAETVSGYALSISRLTDVVVALSTGLCRWTELYRANILPDLAGALTDIVEKAHSANISHQDCWNRLADAIRTLAWSAVCGTLNPVYSLSLLMDRGLFTAAMLCQHHQGQKTGPQGPSTYSFDALSLIVPYLYHEEVFLAAEKRPGIWEIIDGQPPLICGEVPRVWGEMWEAMDVAYEAYGGDFLLPVPMCSNTKVWACLHSASGAAVLTVPTPQHAEQYGLTNHTVWACSRCRWVTYCSSECQQEDWRYVHRYECHGFSQSELIQGAFLMRLYCSLLLGQVTDGHLRTSRTSLKHTGTYSCSAFNACVSSRGAQPIRIH